MKKALFTLIFAIGLFAAVAQDSFNYQAVIRNGGEVIDNQDVKLRISLMQSDSVYYQEEHATKTNAYGNISIAVGEGTPLLGKFSDVPWNKMNIMMRIEADATNSGTYTDMGSMQIQPVPYAMYAAKSATIIQASNTIGDDAIFAVKDSQGNLLFAVYEDGTRFYVDYNEGTKAAKSKFAVAGRSSSKGDEELLTIDNSGTIIYVDDELDSKAAKSKFAVAGRSSSKGDAENLIAIDGSGSTIYVDTDDSKAAKSKFAVAGRSSSKDSADNLLTIDADGTKVYIDNDETTNSSKAAKSKFAVAGRSSSKDVPENRFSIDNNGAIFYVDIYGDADANKAAKSKFAVAGRSSSKAEPEYEFVIDEYGTIVYVDEINGSKAAKSKFAVAGRSSSKGENDYFTIDQDSTRIYINDAETAEGESSPVAFAIVGKTNKTEMLTIKRDSAIVNTTIMAVEAVETASGEITKTPDNTVASKAYSTGKIYPYFEKTVTSQEVGDLVYTLSPEITYTYYYSENGEYLYLIYKYQNSSISPTADFPIVTYNYEYRTYWLVDGNIYSDTAYYSEGTNQSQPSAINSSMFPQYTDTLKRQWNGQSLLVLLESELTAAGFKVKCKDGANYYYSSDNQVGYIEDSNPDVKAQQNIVTGLYSTDVFKNSLPQFSRLVMEAAGIGNGFSANDLQYIGMGVGANENTYGYTLLDSLATSDNIIAKEWEQNDGQQLKTKPESEDDLFSKKHEWRKQSLSAIEYMFSVLKNGFVVMTSPTEGGSVSGISGGNGTYHYGDQITLTATPADGYIFSHWNDGNTENPRTITVTGHTTVWANFASLADTYQLVDLGLTVKWASRNLGASSTTNVGNSYAWGMNEPNLAYNLTDLAKRTDAATIMLGNGYRTPTKSEWQELINDCNWQYDEENNYFKVSNRSDASQYIILPTTEEMIANYWTSEYPNRPGVTQAYNAKLDYSQYKNILNAENLSDFDSMLPIRAVENATRYHVWVNIKGPNNCGTVSGLGIYEPNAVATLTATSADGYEFVDWGNGSTNTTLSFTVTGDTTITAQFKQSAVKLYVAATGASDSTGTGAVDAPFATIARAFAQIVAQSNPDPYRDYEIIVDGMLSEPQKIEYNSEDTLYVNSITLRGKTGNTTDGINAGWDGDSVLDIEIGSALTINSGYGTDVNLIIKNLTIKGGYATNGGGIYLQNTIKNLTLSDGTIVTNNYAHSGGGVYVYNQSFTMEGTAKVTNNQAFFYGGGVYVYQYPEVTIGGSAEISSNKAEKGGGLYIGASSSYNTIIRENATIKQNTAMSSGGGVYVDDYGKLEMQGGAISNNQLQSTEGYGSGVYFSNGVFSVSGSAQIATNNDVYLGGESYPAITIAGALTADTVACITPNSDSYFEYMYDEELDENHPILKLDNEVSGISIADVCNKFAVTPQFVDETYFYFVIDEGGYLESQHKIGFIYYKGSEPHEVASYLRVDGAAMPAAPAAPTKEGTTGSFMGWYQLHSERNQGRYQDIVSLVPYNAESEVTGNETIIGVWNETVEVDGQNIKSVADALINYDYYCAYTINVNGTLNQPQTIGFMGGDIDYNLHSITLQGKSGTNAVIDGGWVDGGSTPETTYSALSIYTQVPVTIQNITIKGGYATNGGGINIDNSLANVTIANGADIRDNYATYNGGGVYAKGTLLMTGGSISENSCGGTSTTAGRGGGVSFLGATFVMSGGSIANNEAKATNSTDSFGEVGSYGGGVYVSASSTMYMYGTAVIGNQNATSAATADNHSNTADCGGGVYIATNNYGAGQLYLGYRYDADSYEAVEETLTGGIYYNYASNNTNENMHAAGCGGGVSAQAGNINGSDYCIVAMASGNIAYNGAGSDGGGIYLQGQSAYGSGNNVCPEFKMAGGNISSNAAITGKGVYAGSLDATCYSRFYMKDSAQIDANNDVYLTSHCPIILAGMLTASSVATITPADYNEGKAVLTYDTELEQANGEELVSASSSKFAVTPQEDALGTGQSTEWTINNDGMLYTDNQHGSMGFNIYVSPDGIDDNDGLSEENSVKSMSAAVSKIANYSSDNAYGTDADWNIIILGTLTTDQTITNALNDKAKSLTITSQDVSNIAGISDVSSSTSKYALTLNTTVPVTLKNISISNNTVGGIEMKDGAGLVTIDEGVTISGNVLPSDYYGAGIRVSGGKLYMKSGVIANNTVTSGCGGGIYVGNYNNATAIIGGTAIIGSALNSVSEIPVVTEAEVVPAGCSNNAQEGGGIYAEGDLYVGYKIDEYGAIVADDDSNPIFCNNVSHTVMGGENGGGAICLSRHDNSGARIFKMHRGTISYNYAWGYGGAIFAYDAGDKINTYEITGGTISHNTSNGYGYCADAAVAFVGDQNGANTISVTMTGGTISDNTTGIHLYTKTSLTLTGGTITNNSDYGIELRHQTASLSMGGAATIDATDASKNILYVNYETYISLISPLTTAGTVANLEVYYGSCSEGYQVLKLGSGSTATISSENAKFTVKSSSSTDTNVWSITDEGKLTIL